MFIQLNVFCFVNYRLFWIFCAKSFSVFWVIIIVFWVTVLILIPSLPFLMSEIFRNVFYRVWIVDAPRPKSSLTITNSNWMHSLTIVFFLCQMCEFLEIPSSFLCDIFLGFHSIVGGIDISSKLVIFVSCLEKIQKVVFHFFYTWNFIKCQIK